MKKRWVPLTASLALIALTGLALTFAPFVSAAFSIALGRVPVSIAPSSLAPTPRGAAAGAVTSDGHWRVQQIAPNTYAIGEPQNDPDNYEYLLVGQKRALLIDAGATVRDIRPVIANLTRLPLTVIPTHLHFDHTNGLVHADHVALVDLPETRALVRDGQVHIPHLNFMGPLRAPAPVFRVSEWVKPQSNIDLGGRVVRLLWTPGHTTTSISVYEPAAKRLFTGDLIYPTTIYAFLPESSLSTYAATADRLLATLPTDTRLYGAHCCRNDGPPEAPWLGMGDLRDLRRALGLIRDGRANGRGLLLRRFPVNTRMTLATFFPFGNH